MLDRAQVERYARHVVLAEIGGVGQAAILAARACVAPGDPARALAHRFLAASGAIVDDAAPAIALPPRPAWWPADGDDDPALAWWRAGTGVARFLARVVAEARGERPRALAIPPPVVAAIVAHARATYPAECCGYLVGPADDPARVDRAVACRNAQLDDAAVPGRDATDAFAIGGRELFELVRSFDSATPARAIYHSHPNGRAYFSATDRALAVGPDGPAYPVQHVVVGVDATGATELAIYGWDTRARAFVELARP